MKPVKGKKKAFEESAKGDGKEGKGLKREGLGLRRELFQMKIVQGGRGGWNRSI